MSQSVDPRQVPELLHPLLDRLADPASLEQRIASGRVVADGVPSVRRPQGRRSAAVLLMIGESDLDLTFTERAATLRNHPGQISFPGGRIEPGESRVDAALRETDEEIGLPPSQVRVLGQLPPAHVAASGFDVAGIVGLWDGEQPIHAVNASEVALVHRFRLTDLADPSHRVGWRIPSGHTGPAFVFDDVMVWGFTAHLVDCLLEVSGLARPWDANVVLDVPPRFFRR